MWDGTALCKQYQTKTLDTKGNKNKGFLKRPFYCWDIPTSSKTMPFCLPQKNEIFMKACHCQRIQPGALCLA